MPYSRADAADAPELDLFKQAPVFLVGSICFLTTSIFFTSFSFRPGGVVFSFGQAPDLFGGFDYLFDKLHNCLVGYIPVNCGRGGEKLSATTSYNRVRYKKKLREISSSLSEL